MSAEQNWDQREAYYDEIKRKSLEKQVSQHALNAVELMRQRDQAILIIKGILRAPAMTKSQLDALIEDAKRFVNDPEHY